MAGTSPAMTGGLRCAKMAGSGVGGPSMRLLVQSLLIVLVLALWSSAAQARDGTPPTELGLRAAPSANTELLLTMPAGSQVSVGGCSRGWCKVVWNSYSGYASESGLAISAASRQAPVRGAMNEPEGEMWPIYPPYPYRSAYYPKADWYRYMPHIFHGYSDDGDSYAK